MKGSNAPVGLSTINSSPLITIQYLHPSIRIVRHDIREPMTAGLDELVLMQAGPLLPPTVSLGDHLHLVDQVMTDKLRLPLPLDHFRAVADINRSRQSVQSQAAPVPKLKRKDTWRSANLKHHGTGSRTMGPFRRGSDNDHGVWQAIY